ncbi:MAG: CsbD family protein [Acidobacteriaceae bacterium]|nr:CsbD family protein [Acidobacteriaceae bacterium]
MNWDQLEGKWKQLTGSAKQKWAKLTDDDLTFIGGSKDKFVGRLQERYGISKEQALEEADAWLQSQAEKPSHH